MPVDDGSIGISANILMLAVLLGVVAGCVVSGFIFSNTVGGGPTTAYVMPQEAGTYRVIMPNFTTGTLHTTLLQGLTPGVCYKLVLNFATHPLNLSVTARPTLISYCQG